jgi:hypothetical protein
MTPTRWGVLAASTAAAGLAVLSATQSSMAGGSSTLAAIPLRSRAVAAPAAEQVLQGAQQAKRDGLRRVLARAAPLPPGGIPETQLVAAPAPEAHATLMSTS